MKTWNDNDNNGTNAKTTTQHKNQAKEQNLTTMSESPTPRSTPKISDSERAHSMMNMFLDGYDNLQRFTMLYEKGEKEKKAWLGGVEIQYLAPLSSAIALL
jgi:hypothetical protein